MLAWSIDFSSTEFAHMGPPDLFIHHISRWLEEETMRLVVAWMGKIPVGYGLAFDVAEHPFMPEWTRAAIGEVCPLADVRDRAVRYISSA